MERGGWASCRVQTWTGLRRPWLKERNAAICMRILVRSCLVVLVHRCVGDEGGMERHSDRMGHRLGRRTVQSQGSGRAVR